MKKIILCVLASTINNSMISAMETDGVKTPSASAAITNAKNTIEEVDTSVSTPRILGKLAQVEFSPTHGTCADVLNTLEKSIAGTIFDGSIQSWVYKGNILGSAGVSGHAMLDDYNPLLMASFKAIQDKIEATTNDQEVISALFNMCKVYKGVRNWMEAIWDGKRPTAITETIAEMRKAHLQTDTLTSILDRAPGRVNSELQSHMAKFHPSYTTHF